MFTKTVPGAPAHTVHKPREILKRIIAATVAIFFAATGIVTTASVASAATPGITSAELLLDGESYDGTAVVTGGSVLNLRVQYTSAVEPGSSVTFELGSNATVDSVPAGNNAIEKFVQDGNKVTVIFKDPWPADVEQGIFDLKVKVNEVVNSSNETITWTVDGEESSIDVIVKKPGDEFANVNDDASKGVAAGDLNQYVSVENGTVVVDPAIADHEISYTLSLNSAEAREDYNISDVLPDGMGYVADSFEATLTAWDEDGLNKATSAFDFKPTITDNSFAGSVDVAGPSILNIAYKATISGLTALQTALQEKYDALPEDYGGYSVGFTNEATFGPEGGSGSFNKDATFSVGGRIEEPPGPPAPQPGSAFGKDASWQTKQFPFDQIAEDGTLDPAVGLDYTLKADLTKLKGESDFELTQNVIISDTLPEQLSWNASDADFITATGLDLTKASECPSAAGFAADKYVGQYCIDAQDLLINVGKDVTINASFKVKTTFTTFAGLPTGGWTPVQDAISYNLRNVAKFDYTDGDPHESGYSSYPVKLPDTDEGYHDSEAFNKSGSAQEAIAPGESVTVDYKFRVSAGKGINVAQSKIVDYIDSEIFDISDLSKVDITGHYDYWPELGVNDFLLSTDADGNLVIELSQSGLDVVADKGPDKNYEVNISLTSKPFEGKDTKSIKNKATLFGSNDVALYWSETSSEVTSYGDEAEVRKRVYDNSKDANEAWVETLDAQTDVDGNLIQDKYVYRVEFIPHGSYDNVKIADVQDALPGAVDFLGFVTEDNAATGADPQPGPVDIGGNIEVTHVDGTVTLQQKEGTRLQAGQPIEAFFAVQITDHTAPIVNKIGSSTATIVPLDPPSIDIEKWTNESDDSGPQYDDQGALTNDGYEGDFDSAPGKALDAGANQEIQFTISNDGGEALKDVVVSDETTEGDITIENMVCAFPDDSAGLTWGGPFEPGTQFECVGTLPGLNLGDIHQDTATVTGVGITSDDEVTDSDDWNAYVKSYAIGDVVWVDTNRDGIQDEDEFLSGVNVSLLDVEGEVLQTTQTDDQGRYIFDNLPSGEYQVQFELTDEQAAKYKFTEQTAGDDAAADSDADPATGLTGVIVLDDSTVGLTTDYDREFAATQGIDPTWDAGVVVKTYAIGDIVWVDTNRDGIQDENEFLEGVKVTLLGSEGEVVATTSTDEAGRYLFDELIAGDYQVQFELTPEQAAKYKFTKVNAGDDADSDSDADPTSGLTGVITLDDSTLGLTRDYEDQDYKASEGVDPTWDAGVVLKSVSVGDFVWVDSDRDGLQGEGEPGIPGVVLELTGPDGEPVTDIYGDPVGPVTTDEDGKYTFDNLPVLEDGEVYTVTINKEESEEALKPYVPTIETEDDRENDSSTWVSESETLTEDGQKDLTLDFGFVLKSYGIGDVVWIDGNDNGLQDEGEEPLAGVTVTLYRVVEDGELEVVITDINGNPVVPAVTNDAGEYLFDNLPAGEYQVQFELTEKQAEKYIFTSLKAGDDAALDSNANPVTGFTEVIVLDDSNENLDRDYRGGDFEASEGIDPTWDAGVVVKTYAIGDIVWVDTDRDGIQGETEVLEGVKVTLLNDKGDVIDTTVTGKDGRYIFDVLPAGDYQVKFELTKKQAAKYKFTTVNAGSDAAVDSDADPATGLTKVFRLDDKSAGLTADYTDQDVAANQGIDPTWDAGVVLKSVSVGDYVWEDSNGDGRQDKGEPGIPGVVLEITGPDGKPVTDVYGKPVGPATTDKDGKYTFEDLPVLEDGQSYKVSIDRKASEKALAKYLPTKDGVGDRAGDSSTWEALSQGLTQDGERDDTLDFGFILNPEFLPVTGTNPLVPAGIALLALAGGAYLMMRTRSTGARRL